jgi:hypothetical protein
VGPPNPPCTGATVSGPTPDPFPASSRNPDGTKATPDPGEATYRFVWKVTVPTGSMPIGDMSVSWGIDFVLPPGSTNTTGSTGPTGTTAPKPPNPKPCHCLTSPFGNPILKLDPTILNKKHLPPDKHNFGMGMDWFLFCSQGTGACNGYVWINPAAKLLTGKDMMSRPGLRLARGRAAAKDTPAGLRLGKLRVVSLGPHRTPTHQPYSFSSISASVGHASAAIFASPTSSGGTRDSSMIG